jgi:hypothetical protein
MDEISNDTETKGLSMSSEAMEFLYSTAKWAKFLSILGLVGLGLLVLMGFSMGALMNFIPGANESLPPFMSIIFGFLYLVIAGVYLYPLIAMLKFANFSKTAYLDSNSENLTEAFRNIKGSFQYVGILTVIGLALNLISVFFMLIFGLATM